jgi:hypothetical protein
VISVEAKWIDKVAAVAKSSHPEVMPMNSIRCLAVFPSRCLVPAAVALCLLSVDTIDAQPSEIRLSAPIVATEPTFISATSVVRLNNGDMIVADVGSTELLLVHGRSGAIRQIGRVGAGPGEYRKPQFVLPYRGGFLLLDPGLRRVSEFNSSAMFVRSVTYPAGQAASSLAMARSIDRSGTLYFVAPVLGAPSNTLPPFSWKYPDGTVSPADVGATLQGPRWTTVPMDQPTGGAGAANSRPPISQTFRVPFTQWDTFVGLKGGVRLIALGESRLVKWVDARGRTLDSLKIAGSPTPVPPAEREKIRPVSLQAHAGSHYPPFDGELATVSRLDRVWLRSLPNSAPAEATWLGFSRGQSTPTRLRLPARAHLLTVDEPYYITVRRTDSDLEVLEVRKDLQYRL